MAAQVAKQAAARASRPAVSADVPILAAKITAPGVPDWAVPRPRITMLIAQGSRWHRLTVVTAPAGAGKTMALASWAAAEPGAVAWVGLDGYGNQPKIFWAYVVAALRRAGMALRTAPPIMRGRDAGHVFLLWLAAALAAQDPPVTLVLDDLHLMTDPEVLDGLDYALRNVGPGLRLVVSGRMVPLPLHRYRLAGDLTEIRGRRSGVHHRRSRPAPGPARHHADRGLSRAPDPANKGLGGRPASGRDLAAARQSAEPAQLELI
jgi:LuxR family maltose regulon positive regulatory protein